jgi:hypothetical protein
MSCRVQLQRMHSSAAVTGHVAASQVKEVAGLGWDCNTDFNAVFDLLLKVLPPFMCTAHAAHPSLSAEWATNRHAHTAPAAACRGRCRPS